jgi:Mrp family chromosome partitioning ATPase
MRGNTARPNAASSQELPPLFQTASATTPTQRPGVWNPHGVERGMKAMESMSVPAVVRNGVEAVSSESAKTRRPLPVTPATSATHMGQTASPVQASSSMQYEQVLFVDGLQGHTAPKAPINTRPTEQALAEIAEPIAFGTGSPTPHAKRSAPTTRFPESAPAGDVHHETIAPPSKSIPATSHQDAATSRRFDAPHTQHRNAPPSIPVTPIAEPQPASATPIPFSVPIPFSPSWEVDMFYWPEVVKQIEASHGDAFRQIGKHLNLANRDGLKVMAITSGERGVGRSTVAMHMARCAASTGLRVALVDGDTFCPSLIDQLRLELEHGWQDCLFENIPLHEVAVHSIADGITLFPLTSVVSAPQVHANLHRMSKLIKRISATFDMVFIDANRLNLDQRDMVGVAQETIVDAAIVVVDTELSIKEKVDSAVSILQGMGLSSIGLVENFQS